MTTKKGYIHLLCFNQIWIKNESFCVLFICI